MGGPIASGKVGSLDKTLFCLILGGIVAKVLSVTEAVSKLCLKAGEFGLVANQLLNQVIEDAEYPAKLDHLPVNKVSS